MRQLVLAQPLRERLQQQALQRVRRRLQVLRQERVLHRH